MNKLVFGLLLTALLGGVGGWAVPRAKAMDPATMAILAPYAMPVAEAGAKYAMRGLANASPGLIQAGVEMCRVFLLPLGVLECTAGMPFGFFGDGARNVVMGAVAPFKMTFHVITLPIRAFGAM